MKRLLIQILVIFVILPGGIAGLLYSLDKKGFFNITQVEVLLEEAPAGQEAFLEPRVQNLSAELLKYKGQSLWSIRLKPLSREVRDENWVQALNIKRSWPNTLSVIVKPHEVKMLLLSKSGTLLPLIESGEVLDAVEASRAPDVALLDGEDFAKSKELRQKAVAVMNEIPAKGTFSKQSISEVRYDDKEGFWMTMIKTGIRVKMGEEQMAIKAARVSQVVDYLESHQFDARVIDANLSKKVLVRLRKDP